MGQLLAHILKDKKTGRLSYRRAYPPELIPFLDIPAGKTQAPTELKRSLQASSIAQSGALDIWREANADWEANVAVARKRQTATYDALSPENIGRLMLTYKHEWIMSDIAALEARGDDFALPGLAFWEEKASDFYRWHGESDTDAIMEWWPDRAERFLAEQRIVRDPKDQAGFERLCRAMNGVALEYEPQARSLLGGTAVPPPPPPPDYSRWDKTSAEKDVSFQDMAEGILENPLRKIGAATKQANRTALRFFREHFGQPVPAKITKAAVSDWLKVLAQRPAKLPAHQRALPLSEIVELYSGVEGVPRMSTKTIMTHLGGLAALWAKAQEEDGMIPEDLPNPFKSRKYLVADKPEEAQQLSLDEMHAIFSLRIFTAGERPPRGKGEAAYWLPLMLLWTGARPEELAQLMVQDIFQESRDEGRWFIRITDEGDHPYKGPRRLKTSKGTKSGRREFPVPQALIDLNFIAYVLHVKASGETALFPLLRTKGDRKLLFQGFSEWWNGLLQQRGILPAGKGRRASREFRHNWTTAARACGIPEEAREYIQGHYRSGATANQDYGSRKSLGLYIDQLTYEGLDLSDVKPWRPSPESGAA
jgi:integrase